MKNTYTTHIYFGLLITFTLLLSLSSCEQQETILEMENTPIQIESGEFNKTFNISTSNESQFKFNISSNDKMLLELIDETSFQIKSIFEAPDAPEFTSNSTLEFDETATGETPENLIIIDVVEDQLPENAIGYTISFKSNGQIASRYDKVSPYYRRTNYKKIYTENTDYDSIKMVYYDDDVSAGYRTLCSGPCEQLSYIFSREDLGVGCQYEYWSYASPNVSITFFN